MSDHLPVVPTTKDFALLERLSQQCGEPFVSASDIARRKVDATAMVFPADVPANIVTLNIRIRFRINAAPVDERVLIGGLSDEVYGMTLLLATPRRLALIGAAAGQTVQARRRDSNTEYLHIDAVPCLPEQQRLQLQVISERDMAKPTSPFSSVRLRQTAAALGADNDLGPNAA